MMDECPSIVYIFFGDHQRFAQDDAHMSGAKLTA